MSENASGRQLDLISAQGKIMSVQVIYNEVNMVRLASFSNDNNDNA